MSATATTARAGGRSGADEQERSVTLERVVERGAPLALAGVAGWLAADAGGYYPVAWGWAALALAWLAALAVVLRSSLRLSRLEVATLGCATALGGWTLASAAWSAAPDQSVLEAERMLVYVLGVAAAAAVLRRRTVGTLLGGLLAAVALVAAWALLTRLLPDRVGVFDPISGYRLSTPLGYWNGLGALCALGLALGLGLASRVEQRLGRVAAGAALPILATALYFTFSRGAWIAFVGALLLTLALDARRTQLVTSYAVLALPAAVGVVLASRSEALVRNDASLAAAVPEGRRLLAVVVAAAVCSGALAAALHAGERRVHVSRGTRRAYGAVLVAAAVVVAGAGIARFGSPVTIVRTTYDAFVSPGPKGVVDLNDRLFNLSGSGRPLLWREAWDDAQEHPWVGSGAGSFERYWLQHRQIGFKVRDAHSVYLETVAELGLPGIVLMAAMLGLPLAAAARARRHPLTAAAAGGLLVYVLHAAVDWDWELPGLTLPALLCGGGLLALARTRRPRELTTRRRALAVAALAAGGLLAVGGLLGNLALDRSVRAAARGDWAASASAARDAQRWAPWSAQPWRRLGLAQPTARQARPYLAEAVRRDPGDWELWLELAWASKGRRREAALARATALNPWSYELRDYRIRMKAQGRL